MQLQKLERLIKHRVRRNVDRHFLGTGAALGGNQYHAITRPWAVESRRAGAFQDRDALDVVGVEVGDGVTVVHAVVAAHLAHVVERIDDRHAVHHKQRLVVVAQRGRPANHHAHRRTCAARRADRDARHFARQAIQHVFLGYAAEVFAVHLAHRVAQWALVALDAQGGYYDLLQVLGAFD